MSLLFLPIPTLAVLVATVMAQASTEADTSLRTWSIIMAIALTLIVIMVFWVARRFVNMTEETDHRKLEMEIKNGLGFSVNMAMMAKQILKSAMALVDYRWGAVYGLTGEKYD